MGSSPAASAKEGPLAAVAAARNGRTSPPSSAATNSITLRTRLSATSGSFSERRRSSRYPVSRSQPSAHSDNEMRPSPSTGSRVRSTKAWNERMASAVRAWKDPRTSVWRRMAQTLALRSELSPSNRSMVTSVRPRAGVLAIRRRLTSSSGFTKVLMYARKSRISRRSKKDWPPMSR